MKDQLIIYTDGSCNNKLVGGGDGGIGVVMRYGKHKHEFSEGQYNRTTSARMEIMALIRAMETVKVPEGKKNRFDIVLHTDNQYCSNTVNKGWYRNWVKHGTLKDKKNYDLWERFFKIYEELGGRQKITIKWIKGHNGHPLNELADKLANEGRKNKEIIFDLPKLTPEEIAELRKKK